MAKIVELIGPPGVGKSAIYKALRAKWRKESNWVPDTYIISSYTRQNIKYNSPGNFAFTFFKRLYGKTDGDISLDAEQRFVDKFPELIDFLWKHVFSEKKMYNLSKQDLRFGTVRLVTRRIQQTQILLESDNEKFVLHDEGIMNFVIPMIYNAFHIDKEKERIYNLISDMYKPYALIYILCDAKENAKRLSARKRRMSSHRGLGIHELEHSALQAQEKRRAIIQILEETGVPVLRIDSEKEIQNNVAQITTYINNLENTGIRELPQKIIAFIWITLQMFKQAGNNDNGLITQSLSLI